MWIWRSINNVCFSHTSVGQQGDLIALIVGVVRALLSCDVARDVGTRVTGGRVFWKWTEYQSFGAEQSNNIHRDFKDLMSHLSTHAEHLFNCMRR